jgi:hypothetical protein
MCARFRCAGEFRNHKDTSTGRWWAPGILPGFTQTIGIVTALLFLARVGLPSCRAVLSPSRCLVQLRPWFLGLRAERDSTVVVLDVLES